MLDNNNTVNSLSSDIFASPLNLDLVLGMEWGQAEQEDVEDYRKLLRSFIKDKKNITHKDYYTAQQQIKLCEEYLEQFKQENKAETTNGKGQYDFLSREPSVSYEELERDINTILELNNPSEERVISDLDFISRKSGIQFYQLQKLYQEKKLKLDRKADIETKREIEHLIRLEKSELDLQDYFPGELGNNITAFCKQLDIKKETAILPIITTVSSCLHMNTQIEINKTIGYSQNGTLYSTLVGNPGSMKSLIRSVFATRPLQEQQNRFAKAHQEQQAEYNRTCLDYKSLSKEERAEYYPDGVPEIPDRPNRAYVTEPTVESFVHQFNAYPKKRIFLNVDEIKRLFDSMNQYKGGKGGDEGAYLEMYEGGGIVCLRSKAEGNIQASKTALSIFGTTQPSKLKELFGDGNDGDGMFSRFLYCHLPTGKPDLPETQDGEELKIVALLQGLYEWTLSLYAHTYVLSPDAYKRFRAFFRYLGNMSDQASFPFMSHVYSKAKGHCARIALNLHTIFLYLNKEHSPFTNLIEDDVMCKAITLTQYFIGQAEYQFKTLCESEELSPTLKAIIDLAKKKSKVSTRDLKRGKRLFRNLEPEALKECFYELQNFGYGRVEKKGNQTIFLYPGDSGDSGDSPTEVANT